MSPRKDNKKLISNNDINCRPRALNQKRAVFESLSQRCNLLSITKSLARKRSLFSPSGYSDKLKSEDAEGWSLEINMYVTDLKPANVPS